MSEYIKLAELGKLICERDIRYQLESQGHPPLKSEDEVRKENEKISRLAKELLR